MWVRSPFWPLTTRTQCKGNIGPVFLTELNTERDYKNELSGYALIAAVALATCLFRIGYGFSPLAPCLRRKLYSRRQLRCHPCFLKGCRDDSHFGSSDLDILSKYK